jgi:hypothetical protein
MKQLIRQYETDWLASRPIFYNTKTLKVSSNINDVIDFDNIELHPDGFNNYLDFGYSVFEQTPLKNVKFMRWSSILRIYDDNTYEIEYLPDPADEWFGKTTNENDVIELIRGKIENWVKSINGEIVLPLSGGFDSRLLASMIKDTGGGGGIHCFTYGLSPEQSKSFEVLNAKKIADILGLNWQQIELGNFHQYFDYWDAVFGVSTHSHGMYHVEFYTEMLKTYKGEKNFLSGIIGDLWAGSVEKRSIKAAEDVIKLGYSHGLNYSSEYSLLTKDNSLLQSFYDKNYKKLQERFYQIITLVRLKIILLSYLVRIPASFGFSVYAPFLDIEIALSMVCLPEARRKNRQWQQDYFKKIGLDIQSNLEASYKNTLDLYGSYKVKPDPLDYKYFNSYILKASFDDVNSFLHSNLDKLYKAKHHKLDETMLYRKLHIGGILRRLGINSEAPHNEFIKKYAAYLTLKPFEYLFRKSLL